MARRPKRRSEVTCSHCENEEDLRTWRDGKLYCPPCLMCEHASVGSYTVLEGTLCLSCLRQLYTVMTFEGPRIRDMELYIIDAMIDYALDGYTLLLWTFAEQETAFQILERVRERGIKGSEQGTAQQPPPHHRITSAENR